MKCRNCNHDNYGCGAALFDIFMTVITGGLWLIWLVIKFLRTR